MVISKPIAVAPLEETTVGSEAPALDPIPRLAPISTETTADDVDPAPAPEPVVAETANTPMVELVPQVESASTEADVSPVEQVSTLVPESAAVDPTSTPHPVSVEGSTPAPFSQEHALSVAERVLSAPVVDDQTQETGEAPVAPDVVASPNVAAETPAAVVAAPAISGERAGVQVEPTTHTTATGPQTSPTSPKGESKVSSWLKSKFSRRTSKATITSKPEVMPTTESSSKAVAGGVTAETGHGASTTSVDHHESSVREVAMAGRQESGDPDEREGAAVADDDDLYAASGREDVGQARRRSTSSVSSLSSDSVAGRGRSGLRREEAASSQGEEFEEARDHFDEKLAPPPTFGSVGRVSDSPVRDSRFQEDL